MSLTLPVEHVLNPSVFEFLEPYLDNQSFGRVRSASQYFESLGIRYWYRRWVAVKSGFTDSEYEGDDFDPIKLNI